MKDVQMTADWFQSVVEKIINVLKEIMNMIKEYKLTAKFNFEVDDTQAEG